MPLARGIPKIIFMARNGRLYSVYWEKHKIKPCSFTLEYEVKNKKNKKCVCMITRRVYATGQGDSKNYFYGPKWPPILRLLGKTQD